MYDKMLSDGWQYCGMRNGYSLFRRIENGRGKWCIVMNDAVLPITYEQALGYEPITDTEKLSRKLGAVLLPHSSQRV